MPRRHSTVFPSNPHLSNEEFDRRVEEKLNAPRPISYRKVDINGRNHRRNKGDLRDDEDKAGVSLRDNVDQFINKTERIAFDKEDNEDDEDNESDTDVYRGKSKSKKGADKNPFELHPEDEMLSDSEEEDDDEEDEESDNNNLQFDSHGVSSTSSLRRSSALIEGEESDYLIPMANVNDIMDDSDADRDEDNRIESIGKQWGKKKKSYYSREDNVDDYTREGEDDFQNLEEEAEEAKRIKLQRAKMMMKSYRESNEEGEDDEENENNDMGDSLEYMINGVAEGDREMGKGKTEGKDGGKVMEMLMGGRRINHDDPLFQSLDDEIENFASSSSLLMGSKSSSSSSSSSKTSFEKISRDFTQTSEDDKLKYLKSSHPSLLTTIQSLQKYSDIHKTLISPLLTKIDRETPPISPQVDFHQFFQLYSTLFHQYQCNSTFLFHTHLLTLNNDNALKHHNTNIISSVPEVNSIQISCDNIMSKLDRMRDMSDYWIGKAYEGLEGNKEKMDQMKQKNDEDKRNKEEKEKQKKQNGNKNDPKNQNNKQNVTIPSSSSSSSIPSKPLTEADLFSASDKYNRTLSSSTVKSSSFPHPPPSSSVPSSSFTPHNAYETSDDFGDSTPGMIVLPKKTTGKLEKLQEKLRIANERMDTERKKNDELRAGGNKRRRGEEEEDDDDDDHDDFDENDENDDGFDGYDEEGNVTMKENKNKSKNDNVNDDIEEDDDGEGDLDGFGVDDSAAAAFFASTNQQAKAKKAMKNIRDQAKEIFLPTDKSNNSDPKRRKINREMSTNRGLTKTRRRDIKNPKTRNRWKYEKKMKQKNSLGKSFTQSFAMGYEGEKTGIKKNLTHSIRL